MRIDLRGDSREYKMMMWIETPLTPAQEEEEIAVEGYRMRLVAGPDGGHDTLITFVPNPRPNQDELLAPQYLNNRTLSALTWKYQRPFSQYMGFGGSPLLTWHAEPRPKYPRAGFYDLTALRHPAGQNARMALAFYRQAQIQADIFLKFLAYYRIVELAAGAGGGPAQAAWVRAAIPQIRDGDAQKRISQLGLGAVVGDYLYESGRCAIAHAGVHPGNPVVDPDRPEDFDRIFSDTPLIKALAEYAIENVFGVSR